jgi:hypothetical protein
MVFLARWAIASASNASYATLFHAALFLLPSRFFRVPLSEIAFVRMIVEAFDGLAVVRSLSKSRGEIEWLVGEGLEEEAQQVADRLQLLTGMCPIEQPKDWTDL